MSVHASSFRNFTAAISAASRLPATRSSARSKRRRAGARVASSPTPIGTATALHPEGRKVFLFALSKTDAPTLKARANVPIMWAALPGFWACVPNYSNGHPVSLPLVGGGQSGVGVEPSHLLQLILVNRRCRARWRGVQADQRRPASGPVREDRFARTPKRLELSMAYRSGTYVAFHAEGNSDPTERDMKYYRMLQAWHQHEKIEFSLVNSHDESSAVRDSSKRETLRRSLMERLRNSQM